MRKIVLFILFLCICTGNLFAAEKAKTRLGLWVPTFNSAKVLYSEQAMDDLVNLCLDTGIKDIYLQVYRADEAWYDSKITTRKRYEEILKSTGKDPLELLLQKAQAKNLKVYAWINTLCLAKNLDANIFKLYGKEILTKDQYNRISLKGDTPDEYDKYYLREDFLFLEPGDLRVRNYITNICKEIVARYPALDGIHLDYLRYPFPVPFLPDARFWKFGLVYGFSEENLKRFKNEYNLKEDLSNEALLAVPENQLLWDNWKRTQVTGLLKEIKQAVKKNNPQTMVSCAVFASPERAYLAVFQDWSLWLKQGLADFVVLMNYTKDQNQMELFAKSSLAQQAKGRVYIGLGAFLFTDADENFIQQMKILDGLSVDEIVIFALDDLLKSATLQDYLKKRKNQPRTNFTSKSER